MKAIPIKKFLAERIKQRREWQEIYRKTNNCISRCHREVAFAYSEMFHLIETGEISLGDKE